VRVAVVSGNNYPGNLYGALQLVHAKKKKKNYDKSFINYYYIRTDTQAHAHTYIGLVFSQSSRQRNVRARARETSFSDNSIIQLLSSTFVAVAIRWQSDTY